MSTSSSEDGSGMAGHSATSSGLESTGSLLFSLPSDSSDVRTEITPPTSPAPSEGKMRTPRYILDASRRLGQISALAFKQEDVTPTKPPKQVYHRAPSKPVANDEAGYDADGDGDGDGDGDEGARAGAGTTATMRPVRRPAFPRIDTRQHRRVASMLATRRPSPTFSRDMDTYTHTHISHPPRAKLAPLPSLSLKPTTTTDNAESYELRRRPRAEPVGLGIGFPENHPLRSRAFTMPVPGPAAVSPVVVTDNTDPGLEEEEVRERRPEWYLSSPAGWKKPTRVGVCAPSPIRLVLRPTFLEMSPSPIECLSAGGAGTFRYDDVHDHYATRRAVGVLGREAEIERKGCILARKGEADLAESVVTLPVRSGVTMTVHGHVGSRSALS